MINRCLHSLKTYKVLGLVVAIVLSFACIGPFLSNPETHQDTLKIINDSKDKAVFLSATVTIASTALSLLPDDTATPLANEISNLSTPLMIIVCILYFEQFMLTLLETLAFRILVPIGLFFIILNVLTGKKGWILYAKRLILLAIVCACIIPASTYVVDVINKTFSEKIDGIDAKIDEVRRAFENIIGGENDGNILTFFSNVATGVGSVFVFAKDALGFMVDGVVVLFITSCLIPAATAIVFIWFMKSIMNDKIENIEDTAMSVINKVKRNKQDRLQNDNAQREERKIAA